MSVDAATLDTAATRSADRLRVNRTLRYAVGVTLAVALAMGIDWQLSYLTPILALSFLGPPARGPSARSLTAIVGVVTAAALVGVVVSAALLSYPVVFLLVEGLILFLLFYHNARGAPSIVITFLMIAVTVIPILALQSMAVALGVAQGLVVGAAAAVVVVWLAYALIPDPLVGEQESAVGKRGPGRPTVPSRDVCIARAGTSTIVVFPVVALFLYTGMTSVLVLVFIALLSMQPDVAAGWKAGKALIVGNAMGGISAIVMFELLVTVPEFVFLLLLTLLAGLWFGSRLFSTAPMAPLFGMAFSTTLLVVLSATSSFGEADAKAWTRVVQIIIAVLYLVVAHAVVRSLGQRSETTHATS
jgi:hypothetical protein